MGEEDIIKKVFLLSMLKKEEGESLSEVLTGLVNTGMFDKKEGKKVMKELVNDQYIVNEELSMKGIIIAKNAEIEFTLE
jgi:polyhydroxyalkanoate synthesis regulator phasin